MEDNDFVLNIRDNQECTEVEFNLIIMKLKM